MNKTPSLSTQCLSSKRFLSLRYITLTSLFAFGAQYTNAQTTYDSQSGTVDWGTATSWSPEGIPNNITDTKVNVNSGSTVNVSGSYSTGYIFVGSSGVLNISGSGASISIGNQGGSPSSSAMSISGNGGQIIVEDGATLTAQGGVYLGSGAPGSVSHPRINVTNATVDFGTFAFYGANANVQAEIVLNEGASFHWGFTGSSSSSNTTLIFNGGATGFGQAIVGNLYGSRLGNLAINPGSYVGENTFTLLDVTTWSSDFNTISFNGSAYTLGSDVDYNGYTWNIDRSGNDLVMSTVAVPEMSTTASVLGLFTLLSVVIWRKKAKSDFQLLQ